MIFQNEPDRGEATIDRNTYGVNDSPVPLLNDDDSESSIIGQKTLQIATSRSKMIHKGTRATSPKPGRRVDDL